MNKMGVIKFTSFDVLSGILPDEDLQNAVKTYDQYQSDFNETYNQQKFFLNISHNEKYTSRQVSQRCMVHVTISFKPFKNAVI